MEYSFEKLEAWKKSRLLVKKIYYITNTFPSEEKFGLTNQIRRAIVSVSSNIAEGSTRQTSKEKARYYEIAFGSLIEVLNQLILGYDIGYLTEDEINKIRPQIEETGRILNALYKSSHKPKNPPPTQSKKPKN